MLIRHSLSYLIARGVPAIISFTALFLYTRFLTIEEFGRYALVLSYAGLVQVFVFQWLYLVLARFLPSNSGESNGVLEFTLAMFLLLSGTLIIIGFIISLLWPESTIRQLIFFVIPLSIASGWMEICLKLNTTRIQPAKFGYMLASKNLLSLVFAFILISASLSETAPLLGLLLGTTVAWLIFGRSAWKGVKPTWPTRSTFLEYATYGLPLAITFALNWLLSSSDRVIISYLLGDAATGAYAVGYDLTQQSLGLLLIIINTAAYPLVMNAFARGGREAAFRQLSISGELIISTAIISSAAMIGLAPLIINVAVGEAFRLEAAKVMPWIAVAAAALGIKAFHLDVAFQLAREPKWQAYIAGIAATLNIALNFLMIPAFGLIGAAAGTLTSILVASFLSWWIGRRVFPIPNMSHSFARAGIVAGCTYAGTQITHLFPLESNLLNLLYGLLVCILTTFFSALTINLLGIKNKLLEQITENRNS